MWEYHEELGRLRRSFLAKFGKAIRERVYQFVDKDTADAMVVLELQFYYPQLHIARRRRRHIAHNRTNPVSFCIAID